MGEWIILTLEVGERPQLRRASRDRNAENAALDRQDLSFHR